MNVYFSELAQQKYESLPTNNKDILKKISLA